jgi:demethylmenaquinone methyltransferase/2-methoxy-6-polyprenyl-1,4-benzoquinol methylase
MKILPAIGSLFSSDKKAYHYLPESVLKFPIRGEFAAMIEKAGFTDIRYFDMTLGVVTVYCGIKL